MKLEIKKILSLGPEQGSVEGLNLSVPAPLTYTSRAEKSGFSFRPLSLGLLKTSEWITLTSWPLSSKLLRTFPLLIMTTQIVS